MWQSHSWWRSQDTVLVQYARNIQQDMSSRRHSHIENRWHCMRNMVRVSPYTASMIHHKGNNFHHLGSSHQGKCCNSLHSAGKLKNCRCNKLWSRMSCKLCRLDHSKVGMHGRQYRQCNLQDMDSRTGFLTKMLNWLHWLYRLNS